MKHLGGVRVQKWLKSALGVLILGLLLYFLDPSALSDAFSRISLRDIAILVGLSFALVSVSVIKWRAFLARLHIQASFQRLFRLYLVGYFINLFTPSFIGGDVVRSLYVGPNVDRTHAVSATFLERYTGIAAMLLMALCAVCLSDVVTLEIRIAVTLIAFGFALATWIVFSGALTRLCAKLGLRGTSQALVEKAHGSLVWGMRDRSLLRKALILSIAFHLLTVVNTAAVGAAVGWEDIPWRGLFVVVPLILLVGAIPISPQGLGIQEGAFAFFLHSVGATTEQAFAIALVLRAKSYLLALIGGALSIGIRQQSAATHSE